MSFVPFDSLPRFAFGVAHSAFQTYQDLAYSKYPYSGPVHRTSTLDLFTFVCLVQISQSARLFGLVGVCNVTFTCQCKNALMTAFVHSLAQSSLPWIFSALQVVMLLDLFSLWNFSSPHHLLHLRVFFLSSSHSTQIFLLPSFPPRGFLLPIVISFSVSASSPSEGLQLPIFSPSHFPLLKRFISTSTVCPRRISFF